MGAYSYDRTSARSFGEPSLLGIIVKKVLAERDPRRVIEAYTEDYIEDYEEEYGDVDEGDYPKLGFLKTRDAERIAKDIYLQAYKAHFPEWRNGGDPLENWYDEWPRKMPDWIHRKVAESIGLALGTQSGKSAKALLDMAREHGWA